MVLVFLRNPWTIKMSKSSSFIFRSVTFCYTFWFCFWDFMILMVLTLVMSKNTLFWHFWTPKSMLFWLPKCHFQKDFWPFFDHFWHFLISFWLTFSDFFDCFATVYDFLTLGDPLKMPFWHFLMVFHGFWHFLDFWSHAEFCQNSNLWFCHDSLACVFAKRFKDLSVFGHFWRFWPSSCRKMVLFDTFGYPKPYFLVPKMHFWLGFLITFWSFFDHFWDGFF